MTKAEVLEKLTPIFRTVFKEENLEVTESLTANDVSKWDSLSNVLMLDEVEKAFDVKFKFKDISKLNNVGDLADLILKYQSA